MKKKLHIGLLEIGIFGSSLVMMGLIFWFLSLTMFGSSRNSEARLLASFGTPGAAAAPSAAMYKAPIAAAPAAEVPVETPVVEESASAQEAAPATPAPPVVQEAPAPFVPEEPVQETPAPAAPVQAKVEVPVEAPPPPALEPKADIPPEMNTVKKPAVIAYTAERDPMMRPEEQAAFERSKKEKEESLKQASGKVKTSKSASLDMIKRRVEVQGIMDTPDGIVAIINNEIYKRGDTVAGAKILRILGNRVQFKYRENIFEKSVQE